MFSGRQSSFPIHKNNFSARNFTSPGPKVAGSFACREEQEDKRGPHFLLSREQILRFRGRRSVGRVDKRKRQAALPKLARRWYLASFDGQPPSRDSMSRSVCSSRLGAEYRDLSTFLKHWPDECLLRTTDSLTLCQSFRMCLTEVHNDRTISQ